MKYAKKYQCSRCLQTRIAPADWVGAALIKCKVCGGFAVVHFTEDDAVGDQRNTYAKDDAVVQGGNSVDKVAAAGDN